MAPDGTASKDADPKVASNQAIADTIQIVSTALLGLTVQCAQCHNHRYDPISQVDYYRMRAVFEPALDWTAWRVPAAREVKILLPADKAASDPLANIGDGLPGCCRWTASVDHDRRAAISYHLWYSPSFPSSRSTWRRAGSRVR
jgi:hypothetical protein